MNKFKRILTYANLMATFAVFLVLGGTALAVTQVQKNSVSSKSIKDAAVTGKDVKDNSVTGADVNEGTLTLPADQTAPTGPAGGDLAGTYPTPVIGPNAVGTNEIAENGVTNTDIATGAVTGTKLGLSSVDASKIQDDSVRAAEIAPNEVGRTEIANDAVSSSQIDGTSVGGGELKGAFTVTSPGIVVPAGGFRDQAISCPSGSRILSGGFSWQDNEPNSIISSTPAEAEPNRSWLVRGMVEAGSNTLFAWANCISQ